MVKAEVLRNPTAFFTNLVTAYKSQIPEQLNTTYYHKSRNYKTGKTVRMKYNKKM